MVEWVVGWEGVVGGRAEVADLPVQVPINLKVRVVRCGRGEMGKAENGCVGGKA